MIAVDEIPGSPVWSGRGLASCALLPTKSFLRTNAPRRKNEDIIKQGAKTESDTGKNTYRLIFQDSEKNKEILDTILSSAYFYNSVSACAANNVCDNGLSCRLFARSMHNYYSNFGGFFDEYKKEWFDNITSDVGVFLASAECVKVLNVQKY